MATLYNDVKRMLEEDDYLNFPYRKPLTLSRLEFKRLALEAPIGCLFNHVIMQVPSECLDFKILLSLSGSSSPEIDVNRIATPIDETEKNEEEKEIRLQCEADENSLAEIISSEDGNDDSFVCSSCDHLHTTVSDYDGSIDRENFWIDDQLLYHYLTLRKWNISMSDLEYCLDQDLSFSTLKIMIDPLTKTYHSLHLHLAFLRSQLSNPSHSHLLIPMISHYPISQMDFEELFRAFDCLRHDVWILHLYLYHSNESLKLDFCIEEIVTNKLKISTQVYEYIRRHCEVNLPTLLERLLKRPPLSLQRSCHACLDKNEDVKYAFACSNCNNTTCGNCITDVLIQSSICTVCKNDLRSDQISRIK